MKTRLIIALLVMFTGLGFSQNSFVWDKNGQGIYESDIQELLIDPMDDASIYAGTSKALYKSINRGKSYRMVLRLSGEAKGVNDIYISTDHPEIVYAATDAGLYESLDRGNTWERIYFSSDAGPRQCLSVIRYGDVIYLGAQKGLFYKGHQDAQWRQIKEGLKDEPVYHIAFDDYFLYLATGRAVFSLEKQTRKLQKIFSFGIGKDLDANNALDQILTDRSGQSIRFVEASDLQRPYIFIATTQGIYFSFDDGENWELLPTRNLALGDLTSLLVLESEIISEESCLESPLKCLKLMVGTRKGVFFLNDGKWMSIYKGMETNEINCLTKDAQGAVYAATNKGIFYLPVKEALPSFNKVQSEQMTTVPEFQIGSENWPKFDHDPSINEVHQMAIDYAEVSHEKIKIWRRQARQKAWLPGLKIGVDGDRDWSRSDSLWGSYSGGGQHYIGPDDKTYGEDFGWDASFSWDLSDLVWSTDQTTIDSRSKMMVELRGDLLNEITRLYFERRRNQIELALNNTTDWRLRIEGEMRITELTALIDALTGGEFSKKIVGRERNLLPVPRDSQK